MPRYTYETTGNGLTLEIFRDGESVAFLQGDDASQLLEELEKCDDARQQEYLAQYDFS